MQLFLSPPPPQVSKKLFKFTATKFIAMKTLFKIVPILFLMLNCVSSSEPVNQVYIRLNQVGYLPSDQKSALLLSKKDISGSKFSVVNSFTGKKILEGGLTAVNGGYGDFKYVYQIDFSPIDEQGKYFLQVNGTNSYSFSISNKLFNPLVDSLLSFFKIQRCGYTDPKFHSICHIADATTVIDGKKTFEVKRDLTGGWHDAGDYVKFLNTTAVATYTLLFAYDFDPVKFGFDNNKNNVPDILEEAKIGLDWMLRCDYSQGKFVTQVQDLRDHDVGWRMPDKDNLQFDRPAFLGMGKNLIGIYSSALALASKIWKVKIKYPEFADKCLATAEAVYAIRNSVPDVDTSGTGNYIDKDFAGKLALGAYELFAASNKREYLNQSFTYADKAGADFWWSWGNINSFAHYRLAQYDRKYLTYIEKNLNNFLENGGKNVFEIGAIASWGTNNTLLGITLQNVLWKRLTGNNKYDRLAVIQRDFILGRNPWGISFISNFGSNPVKNLHHQVAFLNGGKLSGGFAAGPAKKEFVKNFKIPYEKNDIYSIFQTEDLYYRDDRMDFITNEPTIVANATAIFVYGFYSK